MDDLESLIKELYKAKIENSNHEVFKDDFNIFSKQIYKGFKKDYYDYKYFYN